MRKLFIGIITAVIIGALIAPVPVKACRCGGVPVITTVKRVPDIIIINNPVKGRCKGKKIENAIYRKGKIIFKNSKKYSVKPKLRRYLYNGAKVTVYRKNGRIEKIIFSERG